MNKKIYKQPNCCSRHTRLLAEVQLLKLGVGRLKVKVLVKLELCSKKGGGGQRRQMLSWQPGTPHNISLTG